MLKKALASVVLFEHRNMRDTVNLSYLDAEIQHSSERAQFAIDGGGTRGHNTYFLSLRGRQVDRHSSLSKKQHYLTGIAAARRSACAELAGERRGMTAHGISEFMGQLY